MPSSALGIDGSGSVGEAFFAIHVVAVKFRAEGALYLRDRAAERDPITPARDLYDSEALGT